MINFPVRVRRSLDERVTDLVYALRKAGFPKPTKSEIAEMLLSELPESLDAAFIARLWAFRQSQELR